MEARRSVMATHCSLLARYIVSLLYCQLNAPKCTYMQYVQKRKSQILYSAEVWEGNAECQNNRLVLRTVLKHFLHLKLFVYIFIGHLILSTSMFTCFLIVWILINSISFIVYLILFNSLFHINCSFRNKFYYVTKQSLLPMYFENIWVFF